MHAQVTPAAMGMKLTTATTFQLWGMHDLVLSVGNCVFADKDLCETVADVNACVRHPCANGAGVATCHDLPHPALDTAAGRRCTCNNGFVYQDDRSGCQGKHLYTNTLVILFGFP
jgi:hypothetical protein